MPVDIQAEIERLNPMQKKAVRQTEGPVLILAGAGSGKTRVITLRTTYLLEKGISPRNILAVTFTNKAAREMKERVESLVGKDRYYKNLMITTFHSLCLFILRREIHHIGYRKNFSIYDTSDQLALLRSIMSDVKHAERSFKADAVQEGISKLKNGMTLEKSSVEEVELASYVNVIYSKYQKTLEILNSVDFDDLLVLTVKLFQEHNDVADKYRDRFRYLMVDEYQDTNRVQYKLIKMLAGFRKNICVVGDDDQSIYGWRGADLRNILEFEGDFEGAEVIRLEQNYRSSGNILQAANEVIKNNANRMSKTLWTADGAGQQVSLFRAADSEEESEWAAYKISKMQFSKNYSFEDFAIIYRANKFSQPFEEALRKKEIPYTVVGGTSYFDRKEIKDLIAYLKVITNPKDELSLMRAAGAPKRGIGTGTFSKLIEYARETSISLFEAFRAASEIEGISEKVGLSAIAFTELIDLYKEEFEKEGGMKDAFHALVEEIGFYDYIMSTYKTASAAQQRIENVRGFIDSIGRFEKEEEDSAALEGFLERLALTDLLKDKDDKVSKGVTLISLHSAKGLEFPVVFIVGIEENVLPHKKSLYEESALEEERRLFYVGITRGMKELYLSHAENRIKYNKMTPMSPSRFLLEIPDELLKKVERLDDDDQEIGEGDAKAMFANIRAMLDKQATDYDGETRLEQKNGKK